MGLILSIEKLDLLKTFASIFITMSERKGRTITTREKFIQICSGARHSNSFFSGRVEFNHHCAVHFGPVHVVNALHVHQILVLPLHH